MVKSTIKSVLILLMLLNYSSCDSGTETNIFKNITNYNFIENRISDLGFSVCDLDYRLDLDLLDSLTRELENCTGINIDYRGIKILIPTNTYISPCSGQELFLCDIPDQLCIDKGITPTEECPCSCRGAIQDDNILVLVPSLITYKLELARLVTHINNPYNDALISSCL